MDDKDFNSNAFLEVAGIVTLQVTLLAIITLVSSFIVSDSSETSKVLVEFGQPTINSPSDVADHFNQLQSAE